MHDSKDTKNDCMINTKIRVSDSENQNQSFSLKREADDLDTTEGRKRTRYRAIDNGAFDHQNCTSPRRYNLRRKQQLDYIALNDGRDKKDKLRHHHIDAFLRCFAKWENTDSVMDCNTFEKIFDQVKLPYKVLDPENAGMSVKILNSKGNDSSKSITVEDLTKALGNDRLIDVMDVQSQENEQWTMQKWNEYFTHTLPRDRKRIKNVISLEVSDAENLEYIRPRLVEENDLVEKVWNLNSSSATSSEQDYEGVAKPKVVKYILMSVANAYTDWHLDFAGTSVYYNIIQGAKKFILFPPNDHNMKQYISWCDDARQDEIFLGDSLTDGIAMDLKGGDLFMIPAGYIHAVFTPEDSLIFGGNYLTMRDIKTHLQTVEIERVTKVPKRYTFPHFQRVMGKTAEWLLKMLESKTQTDGQCHNFKEEIKVVANFLKKPYVKYKPLNYQTKRNLISELELYLND